MRQKLATIPYYGLIILLVYMPFHVFLSQSLSLLTGGLDVWKVAKDVLIAVLALFTFCMVILEGKASRRFWWLAGGAAGYGALHLLLWATHPDIYKTSAVLGFAYNMRLPAMLVIGYGAYTLSPIKFVFSSLLKTITGVASVIVVFGLLQYILPKDLLSHFGYSLARGVRPFFFIDDNPAYPRIMSSLRDPNSLAAYLLVPIAALTAWVGRQRGRRLYVGVAVLAAHLLAVYLTFSRSAWLAALLVVGLAVWWAYRPEVVAAVKQWRKWWPAGAVAVFVLCLLAVPVLHKVTHSGIITHATSEVSSDDLNSNGFHEEFIKRGLHGIATDPLGHGPGTAGLASIQDHAHVFLTENYYVQIGYELGVLGVVLFVAGNVWLYLALRRGRSPLATVLLASFWGYVVMNMLLHTWSNEAVAVQWWGLAGVALAWRPSAKPKPTRRQR